MSRDVSKEFRILAPEVRGNKKKMQDSLLISLQNALGRENWKPEVQDDLDRLSDRHFVPSEDCLISDIIGKHESHIFDAFDYPEVYKVGAIKEPDIFACEMSGDAFPVVDDDRLDTLEKIKAYYTLMYPWLFLGKEAVRPTADNLPPIVCSPVVAYPQNFKQQKFRSVEETESKGNSKKKHSDFKKCSIRMKNFDFAVKSEEEIRLQLEILERGKWATKSKKYETLLVSRV